MLKTIIKNKKRYGARFGSSCMFVRLGKTRGVKLYSTRIERDFAYRLQKKAAKLGVGPKVYDIFKLEKAISNYEGKFLYGYKTQYAQPLNWNYEGSMIQEIGKILDANGMDSADLCGMNMGRIGKRYVCIDFDMNSHGTFSPS